MLEITTASLSDILAAHALIPEFTLGGEAYFRERLDGRTSVSLIARDGDRIAGYGICYLEGETAYVWLAGTAPGYRGRGVYQRIFEDIRTWAKEQGAVRLRLKTRNTYRAMLGWLVKNDFLFVEIERHEDPLQNRVLAEREV